MAQDKGWKETRFVGGRDIFERLLITVADITIQPQAVLSLEVCAVLFDEEHADEACAEDGVATARLLTIVGQLAVTVTAHRVPDVVVVVVEACMEYEVADAVW
ncbi:hypothetical protein B2J93_4712 [Marssonina coronariae]|uniref:Uncharacterized protein n=1 Tax=Diplocarpon coronariae TaxID=2795749 RepID=A0A218Z2A4_9HELO|nr:hypothetical protein B2J93_4712 [Marssonina coronariae]